VEPSLASLHAAVTEFGRYTKPDQSWARLLEATAPHVDLSGAVHRRAMLSWLNAWGCRIRYPRDGEADHFDAGVAGWWSRWGHELPGTTVALAELTDEAFEVLGRCYADLAATPAARTRSLGPTAAAKMLYALRPRTLMPWDEVIAMKLHGARDGAAYAAHQRIGRRWARRLLEEAGGDEDALAALLGRPGRPLAKLLDEYCYMILTRDGQQEAP
jgi:hypothetical protein